MSGTVKRFSATEMSSILQSIDTAANAICRLEDGLAKSMISQENGQHTLRVRVENGMVKKAVHVMEHEL
jgi:hypothetical protein